MVADIDPPSHVCHTGLMTSDYTAWRDARDCATLIYEPVQPEDEAEPCPSGSKWAPRLSYPSTSAP